jgi:ESCRT-I complex subunit VPS37
MFIAESKSSTTDPESILARLQASAAESEEASDKLADDFFDNSIPLDEFLDKFKSSRTEMHLRKLKAEKMQELLRSGAHRNSTNNHPSAAQPTGFYGQPYPNMMPGYANMMPMPPQY